MDGRWIKPALEADDSVKETLSKMELTRKEHDLLKDVGTLHQFLALTVRLEQDHRKKKGTGNFQQSIANFQTFAKSYSNVVEALVSAGPFGAGHLVWGICSIAVTVRILKVNVLGSNVGPKRRSGRLIFWHWSRLSQISTRKSKQSTKYVPNVLRKDVP
jgi:hypothetical protein